MTGGVEEDGALIELEPQWMLAAERVHWWSRGRGVFPMRCWMCNYEWTAVAAVGTVCLSKCPACGDEQEIAWQTDGPPGDGVWI